MEINTEKAIQRSVRPLVQILLMFVWLHAGTIDAKAQCDAGVLVGPSVLCKNTSITLTATGNPGGSWKSSDSLIVTVDSTGFVTAVGAGDAVVSYKVSTDDCESEAERTFTVHDPQAGQMLGVTPQLCIGSTITLSTNGDSGGSWHTSDGTVATVSATGLVTGVSTGNVNISYSVQTGNCSASVSTLIKINPLPNPGTISGATAICGGTSTQYTLSSNASPNGTWISDNTSVARVDQSGLVTGQYPNSTKTSIIRYRAFLGSCSQDATKVITINLAPNTGQLQGPSTLHVDGMSIFTTSGSTGNQKTWISSDPTVATIHSSEGAVTALSEGVTIIKYSVSSPSCGSASDSLTLIVLPAQPDITLPQIPGSHPSLAINDLGNITELSVFPNPGKTECSIQYTMLNSEEITVQLMDISGKIIYAQSIWSTAGSNIFPVSLSSYSPGLYTLILQTDNALVTTKIVKD